MKLLPYTDHTLDIEKGAAFYLFSDGITSQTGGDANRMFGTRRLRTLLESLASEPFDRQIMHLNSIGQPAYRSE